MTAAVYREQTHTGRRAEYEIQCYCLEVPAVESKPARIRKTVNLENVSQVLVRVTAGPDE